MHSSNSSHQRRRNETHSPFADSLLAQFLLDETARGVNRLLHCPDSDDQPVVHNLGRLVELSDAHMVGLADHPILALLGRIKVEVVSAHFLELYLLFQLRLVEACAREDNEAAVMARLDALALALGCVCERLRLYPDVRSSQIPRLLQLVTSVGATYAAVPRLLERGLKQPPMHLDGALRDGNTFGDPQREKGVFAGTLEGPVPDRAPPTPILLCLQPQAPSIPFYSLLEDLLRTHPVSAQPSLLSLCQTMFTTPKLRYWLLSSSFPTLVGAFLLESFSALCAEYKRVRSHPLCTLLCVAPHIWNVRWVAALWRVDPVFLKPTVSSFLRQVAHQLHRSIEAAVLLCWSCECLAGEPLGWFYLESQAMAAFVVDTAVTPEVGSAALRMLNTAILKGDGTAAGLLSMGVMGPPTFETLTRNVFRLSLRAPLPYSGLVTRLQSARARLPPRLTHQPPERAFNESTPYASMLLRSFNQFYSNNRSVNHELVEVLLNLQAINGGRLGLFLLHEGSSATTILDRLYREYVDLPEPVSLSLVPSSSTPAGPAREGVGLTSGWGVGGVSVLPLETNNREAFRELYLDLYALAKMSNLYNLR